MQIMYFILDKIMKLLIITRLSTINPLQSYLILKIIVFLASRILYTGGHPAWKL